MTLCQPEVESRDGCNGRLLQPHSESVALGGALRLFVFAALIAVLLPAPLRALDGTGPIAEARVYFDDVRTLNQLGDLAGQLDICTWVEQGTGVGDQGPGTGGQEPGSGYLVINTDSSQLEEIRAAGLLVDVTYPDIRQKFFEMTGVRPGDADAGRDFGFFLTYPETHDTLRALAAAYPAICSLFSLGLTPQGRALWCLKISDNPGMTEDEPACFFNAATHAREPLGTSCCVAFAAQVLSEYGIDSSSTWLVNNREIYLVPVMNPDGYVYNSDSGGAESNWRKNRRSPAPPDIGVDLNRNYGYKWGYSNFGSSARPWDETYRGPAPFSEPETQLIRDFLATFRPHTCMDIHTYGQYNLYPWGYAGVRPPDQAMLQEVVDTFRTNNRYPASLTGQVYSAIYPCNGMSVDWEYSDTAGKFVTYAFTCELGTTDFWYGWLDSEYIEDECRLNIPNLYYLTRVAGAYFDCPAMTLADSAGGNGNCQLGPGESAGVWFTLRNRAIHPMDSAYAVTARLVSGDYDVEVLDPALPFPDAARGRTVDNHATPFHLRAWSTIPLGRRVPLRLDLSFTAADRRYTQSLDFEIVIGNDRLPVTRSPSPFDSSRLTASPNPARTRANLSASPASGAGRMDIFSPDGRLLTSTRCRDPFTWDCSRAPAGVYFCRLVRDGNSVTTRVSVVH